MTVGELREALKQVPADVPVRISFTDFENCGCAYATYDVRLGGVQDAGADVLKNLPADVPMGMSLSDFEHSGRPYETRVVRRSADGGAAAGHCFVLAAWGGL